jgi:hypothetical protein
VKNQLVALIEKKVNTLTGNGDSREELPRKLLLLEQRSAEIIRAKAKGQIISKTEENERTVVDYLVHYQYFIKQNESFFMEEESEPRRAIFLNGKLTNDTIRKVDEEYEEKSTEVYPQRLAYTYDRLKAVQYAERWWNDFNPAYPKFEDDCSNYISQCLHAGGIPMWGSPNRGRGWWMSGKSWSYSWTVANALQKLLASGQGIRTKEVSAANELDYGDIICVDFEGDGRFNHSLMVTAKDWYGMPLVNAHTTNSRHRYWTYEDSSAYTQNIVYKFYQILDGA